MPSDLDRAIRQARSRIDDVDGPMRQLMADRYARIVRNLDVELTMITQRIQQARDEGIDVNPDWLRRQDRYIRLMWQAEQEYARFVEDGMRLIEQGRVAAVRGGAAEAWTLMDASGIAPMFGANINTFAVTSALAATYDGPVRRSLARYGEEGAKTITDTLIDGMAQGHSPRKMIREIQRNLNTPANRARLESLIRTEVMRANRAGLSQSYQSMAHLLRGLRWSAALSSRTCLACLGRHGRIFPVDYVMDAHPQCRCILSPVPLRSTVQLETGEQWFARQPERVQRKMLPSTEAFDAYQSGAVLITDFIGVRRDRTWGKSVYQRSGRQVLEGVR